MKRRLFTLLSALSLLLFLAVCALWLRERRAGDDLMIVHTRGEGPPWRRVLVQGWHSGGGLRIILQVERTTVASPPPSELPHPPPGRTPFGSPGWFINRNEYSAEPYPYDPFLADGFTWRGFQWSAVDRASPESSQWSRSLTMPTWFACLVLAALPASRAGLAFLRRRRAARARASGICPSCSYDLRATPERCPECGRVSAKAGS